MRDNLDYALGSPRGGRFEPLRNEATLSCHTIFGDLRAAAARIDEQLPYLFATGSSESCLRDALAYQLHTKHRNIAREYRVKRTGQIADIAVLTDYGPEPKAILELKQLYLKELMKKQSGHHCIINMVRDVARWSISAEVYGIIFVRRVLPGGRLPCSNDCAHVYVDDDAPFVSDGIERMHQVVAGLPCAADHFPKTWQEARIHPKGSSPLDVELYGWVIRARPGLSPVAPHRRKRSSRPDNQ